MQGASNVSVLAKRTHLPLLFGWRFQTIFFRALSPSRTGEASWSRAGSENVRWFIGGFVLGILGIGAALPALATPLALAPEAACQAAIAETESLHLMPANLLRAIARVESGRPGIAPAWPWTVNAEGKGYYLDSKEDAVALVRALRAQNVRSIDVGCMQINLLYHPEAFPSLDAAFDPHRNVQYAAQFLRWLRAETGNWDETVARYHSGDPVRGADYRRRVTAAGGTLFSGAGYDGALVLTFAEIRQGDAFRRAVALQQHPVGSRQKGHRPQRIVIIGDGKATVKQP